MKNLELNGLGVQEMNAEEMRVTDGGKGGSWSDLGWMFAEEIASAWIGVSTAIMNYHINNGGGDARIAIRLTH